MKVAAIFAAAAVVAAVPSTVAAAELPVEPIVIGLEPQFVFDRYVVDNSWAIKYKSQSLERVFHAPRKSERNPLIAGEGNHVQVRRRPDGTYQLWYDVGDGGAGESSGHAVAYAESSDGLSWVKPKLGLFERDGTKDNNIVWPGIGTHEARTLFPLSIPDSQRRGWEHVALYRSKRGLHLVGSRDGLRWEIESVTPIYKLHSDTHNNLVHDPQRGEYVLYCRPKHIYRTFQGDVIDTGESRRIARLASRELWTAWQGEPQTILVPDELDERAGFNCFYGMPTVRYGGLYWGALWCFKMNTDIHTELAWSRDGVDFERLPDRPKLIPRGDDGAWDDGMAFGQFPWGEVGDEWRIYYTGWNGPHEANADQRQVGVGLAVVRKEGLISMRGPKSGGGLVTRKLVWPGGDLVINAEASRGELKVRVSDEARKPLDGLNYDDCTPLTGDGTAQVVAWGGKSLNQLAGQTIRLEFFLRDADLYTFRAGGRSE